MAIVVCNNDRMYINPLDPAPAVVDIRPERIGRRAVAQLLWRIAHPEEPYESVMIEPTLLWTEEQSVKSQGQTSQEGR